jgi:hypothetical protein
MMKIGWLVWGEEDEYPTFYQDGLQPVWYRIRIRIVYAEVPEV